MADKFKVGDRVKIIGTAYEFKRKYVGTIHTIISIERWDPKTVRYVLGDPDTQYIFYEGDLELVKPKFDINDYPFRCVMHCKTEEQARIFCEYLHSVGRTWLMGNTYLSHHNWEVYESKTVYFFNKGTYGDVTRYIGTSIRILDFNDFDWSDFMKKEFTKADLKNGDVVKTRDGDVGIAIVDIGVINFGNQGIKFENIRDNLTNTMSNDCDIMLVRRPNKPLDCVSSAFSGYRGELVYERKEVEEMTLAEVCKALGKEIKIVKE